jgi:branched-chain amino acid transport system substrate-binding protein
VRLLAVCSSVAAGLLVVSGGAYGRASEDPGISPTAILVGGTAPLSTTDAAVARGAAAYFKHVNARGGVGGRAIVYRVVDDGGDPALALQATRRLVEQDRVFALVGSVGTEQNLAARDYLNAARVPQLFAASGAAALGDFRRAPWTIGFQPSHRFEGWVYGRYLSRARPDARVAVLFQDDDYGRELLAGLREGISASKARVVATQGYVAGAGAQAQAARLKASGANVLALFATARVATQALAVWRPSLVILAADGRPTRIGEGALSLGFLKEPSEPRWRDDPALRLYRTLMARHATGANAGDVRHVWGMAIAYQTVKLLRAAGESPTRASVRARLSRLDDPSNPFLLPGIEIETSATERLPLERAQLRRFTGGRWRAFGGLWSYRG